VRIEQVALRDISHHYLGRHFAYHKRDSSTYGDLLSGRLVNWTFEESDIRLNLQLTIVTGRSIDDRSLPMKILTKDITADAYVVSIQVGIQNVQHIERFRSKFLEQVKAEAALHDSKVTSA